MQLYAIGENGSVFVGSAEKGKEYFCGDCNGSLRMRGGRIRQKHFYHVRKTLTCSQAKKSFAHLQMQYYLLQILPKNDVEMEKKFPSIKRIADVAWFSEKIVFEIQCSFISLKEALTRCEDYHSLGYRVVWLLHDRFFNKRKIKESELFLRDNSAYFFRIFSKQNPLIYDQWELVKNFYRIFQSKEFSLSLNRPQKTPILSEKEQKKLPKFLLSKLRQKVFFQGDLLYRLLDGKNSSIIPYLKNLEERYFHEKKDGKLKKLWQICIRNPCLGLWELLLRISL